MEWNRKCLDNIQPKITLNISTLGKGETNDTIKACWYRCLLRKYCHPVSGGNINSENGRRKTEQQIKLNTTKTEKERQLETEEIKGDDSNNKSPAR